jgi:hypothetical protein
VPSGENAGPAINYPRRIRDKLPSAFIVYKAVSYLVWYSKIILVPSGD